MAKEFAKVLLEELFCQQFIWGFLPKCIWDLLRKHLGNSFGKFLRTFLRQSENSQSELLKKFWIKLKRQFAISKRFEQFTRNCLTNFQKNRRRNSQRNFRKHLEKKTAWELSKNFQINCQNNSYRNCKTFSRGIFQNIFFKMAKKFPKEIKKCQRSSHRNIWVSLKRIAEGNFKECIERIAKNS